MKTNYRGILSGLVLLGAAGLLGATDPATKPAKTKTAVATHSIPHDQIVAEAAKLSKAPLVTEAAARDAAQQLLSKNFGTFSNLDVEKLAVVILQQAGKDADADLKAQQAAMQKTAAQKKALRTAAAKPTVQMNLPSDTNPAATPTTGTPGIPDAVSDPAAAKAKQEQADKDQTAADQAKLQTLQDRKAKFTQLLSDMQQQVALSGGAATTKP